MIFHCMQHRSIAAVAAQEAKNTPQHHFRTYGAGINICAATVTPTAPIHDPATA